MVRSPVAMFSPYNSVLDAPNAVQCRPCDATRCRCCAGVPWTPQLPGAGGRHGQWSFV